MATITYNETPEGLRNPWRIPPGYQSLGIPRAEIVFSTNFNILALGAGDGWVLNLAYAPPANWYYKVVDISFMITAASAQDITDIDNSAFMQFQNFRNDGSRVQTQTFVMPGIASLYSQVAGTTGALAINSITATGDDFTNQYALPAGMSLPGMILSTQGTSGQVIMTLENKVASSDADWNAYGFCRMLQYDVSDEFEYLLHTPSPYVRA